MKMNTPERKLTGAQLSAQLNRSTHKLSPEQKADMYTRMCDAFSVPEDIVPFEYLQTQDWKTKQTYEILYANSRCTAYLLAKYKLRTKILDKDIRDNMVVFTVEVSNNERAVEAVGAVSLHDKNSKPISATMQANKVMHAHTKANRRGILLFCGMGILDESEIDGISNVVSRSAPDVAAEKAEAYAKKRKQAAGTSKQAATPPPAENPKETPLQQAQAEIAEQEAQEKATSPYEKAKQNIKAQEENDRALETADPQLAEATKLVRAMRTDIENNYLKARTVTEVGAMMTEIFQAYAAPVKEFSNEMQQHIKMEARAMRTEFLKAAEKDKEPNDA